MHIDVEFRKKASDKVMILESFRSQKLSKNGHSFGISNRERVYTMVHEMHTELRWLLGKWAKVPWASWQESQIPSGKGGAWGP